MKLQRAARLGACVCLVFAWATQASAYRPFDGTDADVAAPREFEFEVGPLGYAREGEQRFLVGPALVINYGLAPGFEAVLEGRQKWAVKHSHGTELEDVALSLKSLLREGSLQGATGASVALETGLLLPGSERRFGVHVASILSWYWPALTLHWNLGNDLLTSFDYAATSSLILEGPMAWRVRPVAELLVAREFGEPELSSGLERSVLLGAIACWGESWSFDFGFRHGWLNGQQLDEARLGFTWALATK
ncbi:MAG TPA: hypothetical protein VER96_12920 [Polyangiaceae bacterium]|nr:hypothetical protein [Polyangiaceae bacterium]